MKYKASVITISDKGSRGERVDTSGSALCEILNKHDFDVIYKNIIPDEIDIIKGELIKLSDELKVDLILTTGGTGFSKRDVTPEAMKLVVQRWANGISEAMRFESMKITPRACLSRGVSGIRGTTLIVNLPGSEKAARENIGFVINPIIHGLDMLNTKGSADCAEGVLIDKKLDNTHLKSSSIPSMDEWLKEAKLHKDADKVGMYLTHNGVVRRTSKAFVRENIENNKYVEGVEFSYDKDVLNQIIADTNKLEGIYYVKTWINTGRLDIGDDLMYLLVGGDIRPNVINGLDYMAGRIKNECVVEKEIFNTNLK